MTKRNLTFALLFLGAFPSFAGAAKLEYGGWIPFWRDDQGIREITDHLTKFSSISPFSYEVRANGTLVDSLKIGEGIWSRWLSPVQDLGIKVIPTVAWFDGNAIHKLLTNAKARQKHEDDIAKLVMDKGFDGIDIDYEAKKAETKDYFSTFLKGLAMRLHPKKKLLSCTIEARMPLTDRYDKMPADTRVANDYAALNKYCDEVRIMAYDQGGIDLKLNRAKGGTALYAPVADPLWAEKTIKEALKTISRKKVVLGVPTYGYEYEVTADSDGVLTYKRLKSLTYLQVASQLTDRGLSLYRNSAGELSYTYPASTSVSGVSTALIFRAASTALSSPTAITRFASFTDADAIQQKIDLAKKYNLKGVYFFKLDGNNDPRLWDKLK